MSRVQNIDTFQKSELRKKALQIIEAAYSSIDTKEVVGRFVRVDKKTLSVGNEKISFDSIDRIVVIGAGKCSGVAAQALESILKNKISHGVVISPKKSELQYITFCEGTHPFPSVGNIEATSELIKVLHGLTPRDLVISLISGGGSTLLCNPKDMTCETEGLLVKTMFERGATIQELNTIRKHISGARGGMLAYHAYPARVISLIFSDVIGNQIDMVASGPTAFDQTTVSDARTIVKKYQLERYINDSSLMETVKDPKYFERVSNILAVSNDHALSAMANKARTLGFSPVIMSNILSGEAKNIGGMIVERISKEKPRTALLWGGEPTVTVTKKGKGGRELELVLAAVPHIEDGELVVGFASDGRDNCDFAGALCDIITKDNAKKEGINPVESLENNGSYKFFEAVGDFILTGETGENVSDLIFALKE